MKRILAFCLILCLAFCLAGCKNGASSQVQGANQTTSSENERGENPQLNTSKGDE